MNGFAISSSNRCKPNKLNALRKGGVGVSSHPQYLYLAQGVVDNLFYAL